eukprot:31083-Pelagococcus_subviridis.AAC.9
MSSLDVDGAIAPSALVGVARGGRGGRVNTPAELNCCYVASGTSGWSRYFDLSWSSRVRVGGSSRRARRDFSAPASAASFFALGAVAPASTFARSRTARASRTPLPRRSRG